MSGLLQRRPELLILILGAYFLLHFAVRLMIPNALELDEAEQILLSQWLATGYNSQPPFYNWLQYGVTSLLGVSLLSLSILKCTLLFLSYVFYWLAARLTLKNRDFATIATLSLLTIPQIAFEAQRDLSHTVATIFASSLFLYGFFRTLKAPSAVSYSITGMAIGFGLISKYNFALLPAAALVAILFDAEMRKRVFDWRLLLTAAISIAIILPHATWFIDNMSLATGRTFDKMTGSGSDGLWTQISSGFLSLLTAILGFAGLTAFIFIVMFGKSLWPALRASNRWTTIVERMLILEIGVIVLLILFAGAESVRDRWLTPLLIILPLYLCMKLDAADVDPRGALRVGVPVSATIMAIVLLILATRAVWGPWIGDYQRLNIPYEAFAKELNQDIGGSPAVIVGQDPHLDGNMRLQMPDVPVISLGFKDFQPAYQWDSRHPIVFVWRERKGRLPPGFPDQFQTWLDGKSGQHVTPETRVVGVPYVYGRPGDVYQFAYAWIYP